MEKKDLLKIAGSLEKKSEHPLAASIMEKVSKEQIEVLDVEEFISVSGRGVKGKINKEEYFGGNIAFMKENNIDISIIQEQSENLLNEGKTVLYFANKKEIIGAIAVADSIKDTSFYAIRDLNKRNIQTIMITGDNEKVAKQIGETVRNK